ncbi:MAG: sulfite exporter TauE/SafE family protein [Deltaproteobacteria bacterium]|nr:sulfite exporter TauE/SafE family protein [Deltaproteobacteria bacterium]
MNITSKEIAVDQDQLQESFGARHPILKEFLRDQIPMITGVFILGVIISYVNYGYLPGADQSFPVAGVRIPIWHLLWMGFWTGYTMGLVGEASGIFSLPYSMSVLQFTSVGVSPTSLIITFLNPFGALLGFWRGKQWNLDLALWLCLGAVLGSPIGPFIRVYLLNDPVPFKGIIGLALFLMAVHLCIQITPWYLNKTARQRSFKEKFDKMMKECLQAGKAPCGLPADFRIVTLERSWKRLRIGYWGEEQSFSVPVMLLIGFLVGVVASALGVGGGFLLVPILVSLFGLPMYVLVAATIPYVITLSITGLISYTVTLPLLTGVSTPPDWSFGLFVASGAILGAWLASKTQKFIPEKYLKPMLGVVTGVVGLLYIINYFWKLPFNV